MGESKAIAERLAGDIVAFYNFIDGAKEYLSTHETGSALSSIVKARLEKSQEDTSNASDVTFESALHDDIGAIDKLLEYLHQYRSDDLHRFNTLIDIDIDGLMGDRHIRSKLMGTVPGALFTGLSLVFIWFGFWSAIYNIEVMQDMAALLTDSIIGFAIVEAILIIIIMLGGTFGIATYVYQSWRARKQADFLSSIKRAITLYLLAQKVKEYS